MKKIQETIGNTGWIWHNCSAFLLLGFFTTSQ